MNTQRQSQMRLLSLFLAFIMVFSTLPVTPVTASQSIACDEIATYTGVAEDVEIES